MRSRTSSRGIALIVVLIVVLVATMLGYMGITLASNDSRTAGGVLDARSRDAAARSGLEYVVRDMTSNSANAAALLNTFVADSNLSILVSHQYLDYSTSPTSIQTTDPGYFALASGTDKSAFKARIVSVDLGTTTGAPSDGIKVTFAVNAIGRNGDSISTIATYRVFGLQVPVSSVSSTADTSYAMYLNGSLANSNMASYIHGDVYINGNTSLNASATTVVSGKLRVNGNYTSNTPTTDSGNAVIAGNLYTNGGANMKFLENLVVQGGITTMNSSLTVGDNLEIDGSSSGNWTSPVTIGQQLWIQSECNQIQTSMTVGGNAFFDACLDITQGSSSFSNVYIGRNGGKVGDNLSSSSATTISGNLGDWHTTSWSSSWYSWIPAWNWSYTNSFNVSSSATNVGGNALFMDPVQQTNGGQLAVAGAAQFWNSVGSIGSSNGITVTGNAFVDNPNGQTTSGNNGYLSCAGNLTMVGSLRSDFGSSGQPWRLTGSSRLWNYENSAAMGGNPNPLVTGASTTNASGWHATGTTTLPGSLFTAPTPTAATAYSSNPYTAQDLNLDPTQTWNQPFTLNASAIGAVTELTAANISASGATHTDNLTAADLNAIYNKYKRADGWLVARIDASSSIGTFSTPNGTFNGKAMWIVTKSINVNGNWPGSGSSTDYQVIWVQTGGSLGNFGSPNNFVGYIRFDPAFSGTMQWGTDTLTGAIQFAGGGSSVTGNSGHLSINFSKSVFDAIGAEFPTLLSNPGGTTGSSTTASTNRLQARGTVQFVPVGIYR
jgi:Tfp pilus assembly protein PilX